ncbi:MAG: ATP-dependent DNA helicase [Candidatus Levybacteria bacterium]|nr:ATP-dependent DNA helicase [Candidatus Levybacteria bacterium]
MNNNKMLNPQQTEAIEHKEGPLLIIAGAGTGKTTVITERIKYLIFKKNILPSQILALTFTDKASHEMEERVDIAMPYGYTQMWISTFHAFCDRILRDDAHVIGLDPGYKLISEAESILLLRKNIFNLGLNIFRPLGNPTKFLDALLVHFSRLKDEDVSPKEYLLWAQNLASTKALTDRQNSIEEMQQYLELANSYKKYEELKIKESVMDFSDLISNTLLLFRKRKNILKKYQNQFKFILVDEFQDTNYAQNELAIALAGDDKNITVVADDDQSIYRFRGAAVSNVLQFKKNFPKAKTVTLNNNYRSTQSILDAAYRLIQHNNPHRLEVVEGIDKKLKSHSTTPKKEIELIKENRSEDEADRIATTIKKLTDKKYEYKDIAILVRANNHAASITSALQRHRIPFQFLGPGYLFQQEEIKDLIAYLAFLTNLSDSVSLFRVLSMEIFKIPYMELNYLLNFAKRKNLTLFEALHNIEQPFLKSDTQEKLINFREMAKRHLEKSKKDTAGQILYYFLIDSKLFDTLNSTDSIKDERRVQNIARFFDRVKSFETEQPNTNIFTLYEWLNLMLQMGDSPRAADIDIKDRNVVNILTVHSSKGLEFKIVFLVNLVSDRFPSRERNEKIPLPTGILKETISPDIDFHLEEERRLFYVGMTRAKERLYFTAANYYGTGKRAKKLSPFVYEALPKLQKEEKAKERTEQLSLPEILSTYQENESKEEAKSPLKLNYITFSNLQMFDICPLHYKAKAVFNVPTPTASVQSFGISIHNTLYNFYKEIDISKKPSLEYLDDILKKEWLSDGYNSKQHEQERYAQATKILKEFYETELQIATKPLGLEMPFSFTLKNNVKVFGKIDRIDHKGNGIEIIDYKTGLDNPKADKSHKLQLAMYALAATRIKDNIFNRNPNDITLTLHFLEGNTKKSMTFKQEDLDKLEDDLIAKIAEIEKSDFKCSKNVLCINCEYKILCNTN